MSAYAGDDPEVAAKLTQLSQPESADPERVDVNAETAALAASWTAQSAPPTGRGARLPGNADAVLSRCFVKEVLQGRYCWTSHGGWMQWDGKRWMLCTEYDVIESARRWVLEKYIRASEMADDKLRKTFHGYMGANKLRALVSLTRAQDGIRTELSEFDQDPDLLNCLNGVVNLKTGELLDPPHDPSRRITKLAPVEYDPDAEHKDWTAALEALPKDVRDWFQVRMGQATTGHIPEDDRLVVQQGSGENGKTSILQGIMRALGDYAVLVSDKVILAGVNMHGTELMVLRGARLALIEETPEERKLNVTRLKKTVGAPTMTAHYMRQDEVTWHSTHTLILSTNYLPEVRETDHATWRRLAMLRYPFTFRKADEECTSELDKQGDAGLRGRLNGTLGRVHSAILAWLVDGAWHWYDNGQTLPTLPPAVEEDTRNWRKQADLIMAFLDDELIEFDTSSHIVGIDLLETFNGWLVSHGQHGWGDQLFAARFGQHEDITRRGIKKIKTKASARRSRRPGASVGQLPSGAQPASYQAWHGVRFVAAGQS